MFRISVLCIYIYIHMHKIIYTYRNGYTVFICISYGMIYHIMEVYKMNLVIHCTSSVSMWKSPGHWWRRAWRQTPLFMPQTFRTVATPQSKRSRLRCCDFGGVALWHLGKAWSRTVECQPCICVPGRRNHVFKWCVSIRKCSVCEPDGSRWSRSLLSLWIGTKSLTFRIE